MNTITAVYSPSEGQTLFQLDLGDGPELYSRKALQEHFRNKKRAALGGKYTVIDQSIPSAGSGVKGRKL